MDLHSLEGHRRDTKQLPMLLHVSARCETKQMIANKFAVSTTYFHWTGYCWCKVKKLSFSVRLDKL